MGGVITIKVFETGSDDITEAMETAVTAAQAIVDDLAEAGELGGYDVSAQAVWTGPDGETVKGTLTGAAAVPEPEE